MNLMQKNEGIMIIDIVSASNAKYKYIKSLKRKNSGLKIKNILLRE